MIILHRLKCLCLFCSIFTLFSQSNFLQCQSLNGFPGLFNVPSAETLYDGGIEIGSVYLAKSAINYGNSKHDLFATYLTLCYLPKLELSIKLNRLIGVFGNYTLDRMFSLRYQFISESFYIPKVTVGFHNPYSTGDLEDNSSHMNSSYIVATKNLATLLFFGNFNLTLGYGSDFIKSDDYQYIGVFGGFSFRCNIIQSGKAYFEYILEYDAEHVNTAVRVKLADLISITCGFTEFKNFSGGISIGFIL
ncbi:MAG: hypothetical protein FD143_2870 [Ignavibacteria bacterium]|nr:MAG: hypothetical protein FD143_2870 [Ignavibacteria bacterium]KAF0155452.1 MAG: hypothetical protein FD188_3130 [Ignavibacteria bacterium]